jgi:predicted kinase
MAVDAGAIAERLPELAEKELREIQEAQSRFRERNAERFLEREQRGRVREATEQPLRLASLSVAGDRVVSSAPPAPCAPIARDVCTDLASLALDLSRNDRADLAERLLSAYAGASGDFELYGMIDFYERQCAVHRAAEEARAGHPESDPEAGTREARRWLLLALSTRRDPVLPPMLVAVGGLVASGKSTIAKHLAEGMGAPRIEADRARETMARAGDGHALEPGAAARVYRELVRRAEAALESGRPVVLDACFPKRSQRAIARELARSRHLPFLFVECRVDAATAEARLNERDRVDGWSGGAPGWRKLYADLARSWESPDELRPEEHLSLDCTRPLPESEARLAERIPLVSGSHPLP